MTDDRSVLDAIRRLLDGLGISYREVHHEPTYTSEDAARVRGEELRNGGKALLMKGKTTYRLFVLPADRRIDSSAVRKELGLRKMRFATPEELMELTGLVPGSVPPFGEPILPYELFVDSAIGESKTSVRVGCGRYSRFLPVQSLHLNSFGSDCRGTRDGCARVQYSTPFCFL